MNRIFFLFFLSLFCLSGCQKSTRSEQNRVRFNLSVEPVSLDPRKARDLTSCGLIRMIFEGLTRTGRNGKVELALAERVDVSEDGRRYIFSLRESKWSNGDPLTANDFAASWREVLDPLFPSDVAHQLFPIKNGKKVKRGELPKEALGIEVVGPRTLAVELEVPVPYFLELVSMTPFFPFHREESVSNGPFILQSWRRADALSFVKNPTYWEASDVKLDGIEACLAPADTAIRMFEEGKLDWTGSPLGTISSDAIRDLKERGLLRVDPFSGTSFLRVNVANPPYSHPSFRRALGWALDRKSITEHLLQGGHQAALALVPPEMGLGGQGYFSDGNGTLASDLMEEALSETGFQRENLPPLVFSFMNGDRNIALAQAIQNQWEKALKIRVELEAVEPKVYFQRVSRKSFSSRWVLGRPTSTIRLISSRYSNIERAVRIIRTGKINTTLIF